jgi:hypothetical protein
MEILIGCVRVLPARLVILSAMEEKDKWERICTTFLYTACIVLQALLGYWWIDALSINQADIEERSEQVKLMSDIYQTATGVFVWLGPEDHFTELAIYLMKDLLRLDKTQRLSLHSAEVRANHPNGLLDLSNWQALSQFFQREWFNRTWM